MKAVWGVCGIGRGHLSRQLPLIDAVATGGDPVVVFSYGHALGPLRTHFAGAANVAIAEVAVPFWVGGPAGIDFAATAARTDHRSDITAVNATAMALAHRHVGRPDVVVSDYEPVAAQYAYAHGSPLVTIDQQSKYLTGGFAGVDPSLYADEVMRLSMMFPLADARLACSFFNVDTSSAPGPGAQVEVIAPILRPEIMMLPPVGDLGRDPCRVLVYVTGSCAADRPDPAALLGELAAVRGYRFDVFFPADTNIGSAASAGHVRVRRHGDESFHECMSVCSSIVATAGHGLLSEAMFLGLPVLAIPTNVFEQQCNAAAIDDAGFGMSAPLLEATTLDVFLGRIDEFRDAIALDRRVLVRGDGQARALDVVRAASR